MKKSDKKKMFHLMTIFEPNRLASTTTSLTQEDCNKINLIYKLNRNDKIKSIIFVVTVLLACSYFSYIEDEFNIGLIFFLTLMMIISMTVVFVNKEYRKKKYDKDLQISLKYIATIKINKKITGHKIGNIFKYRDSAIRVPKEFYDKYEEGDTIIIEYTPYTQIILDMYKK